MSALVLHTATKSQLENFSAHALLLTGPEGAGKTAISVWLAGRLLGTAEDEFEKYPFVQFVSPVNGSISIDAVRDLQSFVKLKIAGQPAEKPRRIIILEQAQMLTTEAQNALLKFLEEPPSDTLFVLTATNDRLLLPTIRSRAQAISV